MGKCVRAEITIDAPIDRVWQILVDLDLYPQWNPFTPSVESSLEIGEAVVMDVRLVGDRLMRRVEYVTRNEPYILGWEMQMGPRFLLHAERCQVLTAQGDGRTHYLSEDRFTGWLTPLVVGLLGGAMRRGFGDCAWGLKKRAES